MDLAFPPPAMRLITLIIAGLVACGPEQEGPDAGPEERPSSEVPPAAGETSEASSAPWDAARARGVQFRAIGQEPGWLLEIDDRWMLFVYEYGADTLRVRVPEPETEGQVTVYRAETDGHALLARIEVGDCQDIMSGERFPVTVSVELDGREFEGCGRS